LAPAAGNVRGGAHSRYDLIGAHRGEKGRQGI
jgi:hypothetical protein